MVATEARYCCISSLKTLMERFPRWFAKPRMLSLTFESSLSCRRNKIQGPNEIRPSVYDEKVNSPRRVQDDEVTSWHSFSVSLEVPQNMMTGRIYTIVR